jgi:hypothetical protein
MASKMITVIKSIQKKTHSVDALLSTQKPDTAVMLLGRERSDDEPVIMDDSAFVVVEPLGKLCVR